MRIEKKSVQERLHIASRKWNLTEVESIYVKEKPAAWYMPLTA